MKAPKKSNDTIFQNKYTEMTPFRYYFQPEKMEYFTRHVQYVFNDNFEDFSNVEVGYSFCLSLQMKKNSKK